MIRRIARPMLASVFVVSGFDSLKDPAARAAMAAPLLDTVGPMLNLPEDKELVVRLNGAAMLAGGALLATGRVPRLAALVLAASLLPTTIAGHAFWEKSDPAERARDRNQFLKNIGLLGGLILASVDTAGKPGIAWRAGQARKAAASKIQSAQASLG
ncbi:MAG: DoxX family membrane protein [Dermatophilaceae bacterium]